MPLIKLTGISKTYKMGSDNIVKALDNVSLEIEEGEFVAILGTSGSGKSTLLAILGLLDTVDAGKYELLGEDISRFSDNEYSRLRNRFFGFIFQMFNLLPKMDVMANAMLPFIYSTTSGKETRGSILEILKSVGLSDRLRHRPNQLSGGQQQRVAVARALSNDPLVILADEPTGNLDSKSTEEIIALLKNLNDKGRTIIMVTHNDALTEYASRVITLKDGYILKDLKKRTVTFAATQKGGIRSKLKKRNYFTPASISNYFVESYLTLTTNKLRSFLSILGVMIGVSAVIAMLAVGTGAKMQVEKSISSLGSNLLSVRASNSSRGISYGSDSQTRFTLEDMAALKKIPSVAAVVPYVNGRAQIVYQNKNWNTFILGTNTDYPVVRSSVPTSGRYFSEQEITTRAKVAVLGTAVVEQLFGDTDPIGKQILINRINFVVIGVFPEKGASGFRNNDDQIAIPITTAMYRLIGTDYVNNFDVQAVDSDSIADAMADIPPVLMKLHKIPEQNTDAIDIRNMADIQKAATDMASTFSLLLGTIAAVSLLVGGIGIMNIMLVMVMERTKEIGLRKALGAENYDIMIQFLIEAVMICLTGGLLGILFGGMISLGIGTFAGWSVVITPGSVFMAFFFSAFTGILFGLWPALRASKLLPIIALRYE